MSTEDPTSDEPRRKRPQTNKGLGTSVAFSAGRGALLIGVAIIIGIVLLQVVDNPSASVGDGSGSGSGTKPTASSDKPTETTTPALRPPAEVTVQVLNGSGVQGAAGILSTTLAAFGYAMLEPQDTDSAQGEVVYCSGGFDGEAAALAANVGGEPPLTQAVMPDPRPSSADPDANCLVVLGVGT